MGPIDLECSELVLQSWSIKSVFRNTNCIINQVFKQIKVKQKDPIPNSNVSNENEATQTSNQTTAENITVNISLWYHINEKKENRSINQLEKL